MAMEPINVYSRRIDPRGVLALLRSLDPNVRVVGPDDDWKEATIAVKRNGGDTLILAFRHDSEYYDDEDWPQQMFGMQGYFSRFPECERKADVLRLIGTFRFSLATDWQPDELDPEGDERLGLLFAVAEHLDGALFTPSSLRDSQGRILIDAGGESDPDAVLPQMPASVGSADDEDDDVDDDPEPDPPTAVRVARRALSLTAVAARALAEQADPSTEGIEEYRKDIVKWAEALDLGEELEPEEWKALQRPIGRLDQRATINSTWRLEGLGVLAWALGRFDLPPHDVLVDPQRLLDAMLFLDEPQARQLLADPQLRSREEIASLKKRLLAIHWRLRNYSLRPEPMDFRDFAQNCWFGPLDIGDLRLVDGDLAIGEFAIADAPDDLLGTAHSAAMERHQAINWLDWGGAVYSETDTST